MKRQTIRSCAAFTLVEAMIASIILGVVLVSVLATTSQCMLYLKDMRQTARSSQVLQQQMEAIRLYTNWPSLYALNNTTFTNTSVDISGIRTNTWIGTVTVASYSPYTTAQVFEVTTSVIWTNHVRVAHTNCLSTLISNGGLDKYIF